MINSTEDLKRWFELSGVAGPLAACIGPLPRSRAGLIRYASDRADNAIRSVFPHHGSYRLALNLTPLEARIWSGDRPVWGGVIGPNRFRLCPPGEHGQFSRASGCDIVNVFIPVALVDSFASQRSGAPGRGLSVPAFVPDRLVFDLVHKMLDAGALAGELAQQACDGLMTMLVCYLLEHYSTPLEQPASGGLSGVRLRRVLDHIDRYCADALSNAVLAGLCGMSEAHFSREFRRAIGMPPHQYITRLRLERASAALLAPDARILDVAQECGFVNASHFSRAFSAQYGATPSFYRQSHLSNNGKTSHQQDPASTAGIAAQSLPDVNRIGLGFPD